MKVFFIVPCWLLFVIACHSTKSIPTATEGTPAQKAVASPFGPDYAIRENKNGAYILAYRKHKKLEDLFATVEFSIYDKQTQTVIFNDELKAGSVAWYSEFEIVAKARNLKSDSSNQNYNLTYFYDVQKRTKRIAHNE